MLFSDSYTATKHFSVEMSLGTICFRRSSDTLIEMTAVLCRAVSRLLPPMIAYSVHAIWRIFHRWRPGFIFPPPPSPHQVHDRRIGLEPSLPPRINCPDVVTGEGDDGFSSKTRWLATHASRTVTFHASVHIFALWSRDVRFDSLVIEYGSFLWIPVDNLYSSSNVKACKRTSTTS